MEALSFQASVHRDHFMVLFEALKENHGAYQSNVIRIQLALLAISVVLIASEAARSRLASSMQLRRGLFVVLAFVFSWVPILGLSAKGFSEDLAARLAEVDYLESTAYGFYEVSLRSVAYNTVMTWVMVLVLVMVVQYSTRHRS